MLFPLLDNLKFLRKLSISPFFLEEKSDNPIAKYVNANSFRSFSVFNSLRLFLIARFSILFKSYLLMSLNMFCESADTLKNNNIVPPPKKIVSLP